MGKLIFNDISSESLNVQVEHFPDYEMPAKEYTITHVPGRNGDIVLDLGSYSNVERSYDIAIGEYNGDLFPALVNRISEWLNSVSGYARLEDSYEPLYFRKAMYKGDVTFTNILMRAGRATVTFDCKPQRYLKTGEDVLSAENELTVYNPTAFASLPLIKISGSGSVGVVVSSGSSTCQFSVTLDETPIIIDSDLQDAYGTDGSNMNSVLTLTDNYFPKFYPGYSTIEVTSDNDVTLEVTPRWWTI